MCLIPDCVSPCRQEPGQLPDHRPRKSLHNPQQQNRDWPLLAKPESPTQDSETEQLSWRRKIIRSRNSLGPQLLLNDPCLERADWTSHSGEKFLARALPKPSEVLAFCNTELAAVQLLAASTAASKVLLTSRFPVSSSEFLEEMAVDLHLSLAIASRSTPMCHAQVLSGREPLSISHCKSPLGSLQSRNTCHGRLPVIISTRSHHCSMFCDEITPLFHTYSNSQLKERIWINPVTRKITLQPLDKH